VLTPNISNLAFYKANRKPLSRAVVIGRQTNCKGEKRLLPPNFWSSALKMEVYVPLKRWYHPTWPYNQATFPPP
jgi:hypothetical protein